MLTAVLLSLLSGGAEILRVPLVRVAQAPNPTFCYSRRPAMTPTPASYTFPPFVAAYHPNHPRRGARPSWSASGSRGGAWRKGSQSVRRPSQARLEPFSNLCETRPNLSELNQE